MLSNPVLVQIIRGDMVESFFRGAYVIMDAAGQVIDTAGDVERLIYPRSALKPIQALGMMKSGAANAFQVSPPEIALACASHNGEERHVRIVNHWLARLGLSCDVLECGIHASMNKETMLASARKGHRLTPAHNACSGKHVGFVSQALYLKVPVSGYLDLDHPVQQYVNTIIEEVIEIDVANAPKGIDGCQAPVIGMPLKNLARGMARMGRPQTLGAGLTQGAQKIMAAIQAHPELIAGTGRFCSAITQGSKGKILAKMGADGVFSVMVPEKGLGIALKIDDGHLVAAEVALMGILKKHHLLPENPLWKRWANPVLKTWNKKIVGEISFVG
ncbi:MAG: asparaginase [Alphaproteobacteria bacterium]|jgi:L-asparaginase II|nr:asparaginase [Alphaproteobacteria bacterium]